MKKENIQILSSFDGLSLDVVLTIPENVKGIVQFAHGMAEHKERYLPFMEYLTENGYVCCINDHRGHGKSIKDENDLGYFYDKTGQAVTDDIHQITLYLLERFPDVPITLFGHSMGSLIVRAYARKYDADIDKLVVCGSPSANSAAGIAIGLIDSIALFKGDRYVSPLIESMTTGGYNKAYPDETNSWLSVNRENVHKYNEDTLCGYPFKLNGYRNLMILMKDAYRTDGWVVENCNLPIMFISGADDVCAVNEEKWKDAVESMKSHGYNNVFGKMYPGKRHEILNEDGHEEVYKDVLEFISK